VGGSDDEMAKRAALGTVFTAVALFVLVFFVLWAFMSMLEYFITGSENWPGQKPKLLHRTAVVVPESAGAGPTGAATGEVAGSDKETKKGK
jgi:hypothetical protein